MDSDDDMHMKGQDGWRGRSIHSRRGYGSSSAVASGRPGSGGAAPATSRVLMVNSMALFAQGLRVMLEATQAFQVVGECRDAAATMAAIEALVPGLVVLDDTRPDAGASRLSTRIMRQHPRIGVVVLTDRPEARFGRRGARGTGHACLPKSASIGDLLAILHRVAGRALAGAAVASPGSGRYGKPAVLRAEGRPTAPGQRVRRGPEASIQARRSLNNATH